MCAISEPSPCVKVGSSKSKPSPPSSLPLGATADNLSDATPSPVQGAAASLSSPSTDSMGDAVPDGGILLESDSGAGDVGQAIGKHMPPLVRMNSRNAKFKHIPRMDQVRVDFFSNSNSNYFIAL